MTAPRVRTTGPTAARAGRAEEELGVHEPQLAPLLRRELPRAADVVSRRLLAAALREGLVQTAGVSVGRHGFDRLEPTEPVPGDPARLLDRLAGRSVPAVREELADAATNLALALARRSTVDRELLVRARETGAADLVQLTEGMAADERTVVFERLATEGHNLHPCGRTRIGWRVDDLLAHDLESPVTSVAFLAVRRDLHVGDDVAAELLGEEVGPDPARYVVTPVHPWQRRHVLRGRYADLVADGALVPLDLELPALVTSALRTLLVLGTGRFVKLSLDIQVTSSRRTISVASTRNGPTLSRLLPDLLADDRVLLMPETAGSAVVVPGDPGRQRDLAAIVRSGLTLAPGEVAVPGAALPCIDPISGTSVLAGLVRRFAATRGIPDPVRAASVFLGEYARLLLAPTLGLATRHGIALEAHLQNCLPTFVDGAPHRLAVRDFAGMRIHAPRLARRTEEIPPLWPGSVIVTEKLDVMRAKIAYTALQAHLGEVVLSLGESHALDEASAWTTVRSIVDEIYDDLAVPQARADHAFLTAPTVPHKALLSMRLRAVAGEPGDHYVAVANPLAAPR